MDEVNFLVVSRRESTSDRFGDFVCDADMVFETAVTLEGVVAVLTSRLHECPEATGVHWVVQDWDGVVRMATTNVRPVAGVEGIEWRDAEATRWLRTTVQGKLDAIREYEEKQKVEAKRAFDESLRAKQEAYDRQVYERLKKRFEP